MLDHRRHAPVGRPRPPFPLDRPRGLPHLYSARKGRPLPDLYTRDPGDIQRGGFKWVFSTLLSAAVALLAVGVVIVGSADNRDGAADGCKTVMCWLDRPSRHAPIAPQPLDGLRWASPKADRLQMTNSAPATRYIIHEEVRHRQGNRQRIGHRPYARIVARLATIPVRADLQLPPFNPFSLYSPPSSMASGHDGSERSWGEVAARVVELIGGLLPSEDGQELDDAEVALIVGRTQEAVADLPGMRPSFTPDGAERLRSLSAAHTGAVAPQTTVIAKMFGESDEPTEDIDGRQIKRLKSQRGDTPTRLLVRAGADPQSAKAIMDAARSLLSDAELSPNHEAVVVLVPSLARGARLEPISFALSAPGGVHRVTVARSAAGELMASEVPLDEAVAVPAAADDQAQASSLYASIYRAGLGQGVTAETIEQLLHIFAYDADYRRRVRLGDMLDVFFDLKEDERSAITSSAELLYAALSTGSSSPRFWRFRTHDGVVDYYDESGNNSRKFLIRQPVRYEDVRLTSGFGMRMHPLLGSRKMHTGVDLAVPSGTPILAAGNGVVDEAKWKGEYGNYVRIRHVNGYQTAYGHMQRFGAGIREGVRVTQGQVIGYVGSTGQSSGPHLHYEILVNNQLVDPLQLQVPRERRLAGRELAEFHKERARIDALMHLRPVRVEQLDSGR